MWFLRRPAEKPAFQCGLEVRVQFRDSKLTKIADFRHFDTVNKSRKFIEAGTERPAKIRSCNVPTRLSKSPAIHLQCQLCAPSPDFAFTSPQPSPKRTAIAIDDRGASQRDIEERLIPRLQPSAELLKIRLLEHVQNRASNLRRGWRR